jgi:hypothetical protein
VTAAATLFSDEARAMLEASDKPDVIVTALPFDLIMRVVNGVVVDGDDDAADRDHRPIDFRDLLKAKALHLRKLTQLAWPTLWDDHERIPRKLKNTQRRVQDSSSRAWNCLNALFYKAGRAPWRLPRLEDQLKTSYIGIGFYRDLSGQRLLTSTAQMFDERGRGLILRGGRACTDRADLHPYLDRADAYDLVRRSLKAYQGQHHHAPARVIIMKTSRFQPKEADGIEQALSEANVSYRDLVWISESALSPCSGKATTPRCAGS